MVALALNVGACSDDTPTADTSTTTAAAGTSASDANAPATTSPHATAAPTLTIEAFPVPAGSGPHDVSPALDGNVWFTAQRSGRLGLLDPATGESTMIDLGDGSRPHGVITGSDGAAWVTDSGRNSIKRVEPSTFAVTEYPLPGEAGGANLNTAAFADDAVLWFTGQEGWYGKVADGAVEVYRAPRGRGPYGITVTPRGEIYFASLAGSYVGRVDGATGDAAVLEPPVPGQGARRVWSDSDGRVWVSAWNSGDVFVYDPSLDQWRSWRLPGDQPQPYAVFVDDTDAVWLSDFGSNALVRFDPATETFTSVALPSENGQVRQLHGRPGEVWGAESAADQLVVVRTAR